MDEIIIISGDVNTAGISDGTITDESTIYCG